MATRSKLTDEQVRQMNVYEKLLNLRIEFAAAGVKKTGINIKMGFDWYQVEDIMPKLLELCDKYRLLMVTDVHNNYGLLTVINLDKPDEDLDFFVPNIENPPIETRDGRAVTSPMQAMGAGITYVRRYLLYLVLDLTQSDEVNPAIGQEPEDAKVQKAAGRKAPPTAEKREEIKEQITAPTGAANTMAINSLKKKLAELIQLDTSEKAYVAGLKKRTDNFSNLSKVDCENLVLEVNAKLKALKAKVEVA